MAKQVVVATMKEAQEDINGGCVSCGEIQYGGVEPDARNYECECCGKKAVFGLGELAIMGLLEIRNEEDDIESAD